MGYEGFGGVLGGGDADVHRWLMEHGAYSGTMGNVSDRKRGRLRVKGRERERESTQMACAARCILGYYGQCK